MSNLKSYISLTETVKNNDTPRKVAVFTFGRFQPPTRGHKKLIDAVQIEAKKRNADAFVVPSQTVDKPLKRTGKVNPDKSRNPLGFDAKVVFMKQLFPDVTIVKDLSVKTAHLFIPVLVEKGYTDLVFVIGSDRIEEFTKRWLTYAQDAMQSAEIVSAGERDPDASDVSGMSSTAARDAAKEGNLAKFRAATGWDGEIVENMYVAVRKGMGVE